MDDLVAFLRARLDEDEQAARAAVGFDYGVREWADDGDPVNVHIARHDPARVLRGVAAKRAAINEYAYLCERALNPGPYPQPDEAGRFEVAAMMARALAAEWDDHSDYQEGWKP